MDSELGQLTTNALGAPEPILSGSAADQREESAASSSKARQIRARRARPRLPAAEQTPPTMPAEHRLGLREQQRVARPRQRGREQLDQAALMGLAVARTARLAIATLRNLNRNLVHLYFRDLIQAE